MNILENSDYDVLGLRCGLEVHYQLDTKKKLFCRCPVRLQNRPPDAVIVRHMRPTLSELGEYDGTALMEFKTKKEVHYQLYYDSVCTYEMDDTPPFVINKKALEIAIEIALMLNCQIVDEVHVSRKQYLDGSIPTGFQRTIAVGVNGWIPRGGRKIRVVQVCLEEDACREISDKGHVIIFRTDRLSVPLVEVITAPDMKTPSEACEVDREIGRILRSTRKVRRGIGTVRQDVNVSITGGTRVEIKGVPRTGLIRSLVHYEVLRQESLLSLKQEINKRGIEPKTRTMDCTDLFARSKCNNLWNLARQGYKVSSIVITDFSDLLKWDISPHRTFEDELKGRVRVIACLDNKPILFSQERPYSEGVSKEIWRLVRRRLNASNEDAVIIVSGPEKDVDTALSEIDARVAESKKGVPNETRQVLKGGETDFERILPGPNRMYPDTDSTPIPISDSMLKRIQVSLPVTPQKWRKRCEGILKQQTINQLMDMDIIGIFWKVLNCTDCDPKLLAYTLTSTLPFLRRAGCDVSAISEKALTGLFRLYTEGRIIREVIPEALRRMSHKKNIEDLLVDSPKKRIRKIEIKKIVQKAFEESGARVMDKEKRQRYLIGIIKERIGKTISGKIIARVLKEYW